MMDSPIFSAQEISYREPRYLLEYENLRKHALGPFSRTRSYNIYNYIARGEQRMRTNVWLAN